MQPGQKVELTAGTIANMTRDQFISLQSLCSEGSWDHLPSNYVVQARGTDPLGVRIDPNGFFIGIEQDGYTHS